MNEAKDIQAVLKDLLQLDVDAIHAYESALTQIEERDVYAQIASFKQDHIRHVEELSTVLSSLGAHLTEAKPDLKGLLLKGITALRSATGTEGALRAMKTNEEMTANKYHGALNTPMPADLKRLVRKNATDEERHLGFITEILDKRSWESAFIRVSVSRWCHRNRAPLAISLVGLRIASGVAHS